MPGDVQPSIASALPAEILACCFFHLQKPLCDAQTPSSSSSVLRPISHVCRHWRFAALAYSSLWVDVSTRVDSPQWIVETINRSGVAPLHVDLCWEPRAATDPVPSHVDLLLSASTRAERLSCFGPNLASRLRYIPSQPLKNLGLLVLGTLCDDALGPSDFDAILQRGLPRLRSLITMGCQLPWSSPNWSSLSHTLTFLSISSIPQPLRPSPLELQSFLSGLQNLEELSLDNVLPIYPPPSLSIPNSRAHLPKLRLISVSQDTYQNMASFLSCLSRDDPSCQLSLRFTPQLPSRSNLMMSIPSFAMAARSFILERVPTKTSSVPECYDARLREVPDENGLYFSLSRAAFDASPEVVFTLDLAKGDTSTLLDADSITDWSWSDAGASAAALPLALSTVLPIRTFTVECAAFAHARAWNAAFGFARTSPARVRAKGAAVLGLVAALAGVETVPVELNTPSDTAFAMLEILQDDCVPDAAPVQVPLLHGLTHLAISLVDLSSREVGGRALADVLADALCVRACDSRVASLEYLAISDSDVSEAQIKTLEKRLESCVIVWDRKAGGLA